MTQNKGWMDKDAISEVMRAMGRRGGKVGGRKRMEALTAEERSELARKAVAAREAKRAKAASETAGGKKKPASRSPGVQPKKTVAKKKAAKKKVSSS